MSDSARPGIGMVGKGHRLGREAVPLIPDQDDAAPVQSRLPHIRRAAIGHRGKNRQTRFAKRVQRGQKILRLQQRNAQEAAHSGAQRL